MQPDIPGYISILFFILVLSLLFFILKYLKLALIKTFNNRKKANKIYIISFALMLLWLLVLAVMAQADFLNNYAAMPPLVLTVLVPPIIVSITLVSSKIVINLLNNIPLYFLIYIQTFRVIIEILLWLLYRNKIVPVQMTFEGNNYDILIGLSALFVAYYNKHGLEFFNRKWVLILWNIAGLMLLANIVIVAILSAPLPLRYFTNDPVNTIVFYFPFVWLPGFVAPVAFTMHLFSLRKLHSGKY